MNPLEVEPQQDVQTTPEQGQTAAKGNPSAKPTKKKTLSLQEMRQKRFDKKEEQKKDEEKVPEVEKIEKEEEKASQETTAKYSSLNCKLIILAFVFLKSRKLSLHLCLILGIQY